MTTRRATRSPTPAFTRQHRLTILPDPPRPLDYMQQFRRSSRIYITLENHLRSQHGLFIGGEGYLSRTPHDLRRAPVPDCLVALNVPIPPDEIIEANGYVISEVGKPPDLAIEVASRSTGRRDYTEKREIYAELEVLEYWRFDRTGGMFHDAPLAGDRLVNGRYVPIPVEQGPDGIWRGYSEVLGLELHWVNRWLRFFDPVAGEYIPEMAEVEDQRDEAREQRDEAREQRDEEASGRLAAEVRAGTAEAGWEREMAARLQAEAETAELRERLRRLDRG